MPLWETGPFEVEVMEVTAAAKNVIEIHIRDATQPYKGSVVQLDDPDPTAFGTFVLRNDPNRGGAEGWAWGFGRNQDYLHFAAIDPGVDGYLVRDDITDAAEWGITGGYTI